MKYKILPVKNIMRLRVAADALISRSSGLPGMGLVFGPTGYGKTTAVGWLVNQCNGIYVRAMRMWTAKSMLEAIARELDIETKRLSNAALVEQIVEACAISERPLFIDEADYVTEKPGLCDTLRDIHDMSTIPVILIGMHGIEHKIRNNPQLTGRIAERVEFQGIDREDAQTLVNGLAEVVIDNGLIDILYSKAQPRKGKNKGAEVRRFLVGMAQIENYAKRKKVTSITASDWPVGKSFFTGKAVGVK